VHKTGGEGLYVGNSFYAEGGFSLLAVQFYLMMYLMLRSIKTWYRLYRLRRYPGWAALFQDAEVYNNIVKAPGLKPFASGQNNGIQIGEGTGGKCYNNLIKNAPGNGIIVLGLGDNLVYNNYIINSGESWNFRRFEIHPRALTFRFINNTIIYSALWMG
jgi:hypothetical protein